MTAGISYDNRKTAVVIADTEASFSGRKSDSFTKLEEIAADNYHAVIFGAGLGNELLRILSKKQDLKTESFEDFADSIRHEIKDEIFRQMDDYIKLCNQDIEIKASLITDEDEKRKFIKNQKKNVLKGYKTHQNELAQSIIAVVGYDKQEEKLRKFRINFLNYTEEFSPIYHIGSGVDGANMYFSRKTQGLDAVELKLAELLFHTVNSYSWSTTNIGVGGTPRIAMVDKEGVKIKQDEEVAALTTAANAYQAGLLTEEEMQRVVKQMLSKKGIAYKTLAKKLGFSENILKSAMIPYGTLQEIANRKK